MTVKEVLSDAAAIAGTDRIAPDSRALGALRRALYTVFRDTGCEGWGKILAHGIKPLTRVKLLTHTPDSVEHFTITGGAYGFAVSGRGGFTVRDRRGERRFSFDSVGESFRGIVVGGGSLEFFGEYAFTVFNLTDYPTPAGEEYLPDGSGERRYDLTDMLPDFLSLSSTPTDSRGGAIAGIRAIGGVVYLPEEYTGEVRFSYFRRPTSPVVEEAETLDVHPAHAILLAPLTAAYLSARDDPETSAECMKIYRDMLSSLPTPKAVAPSEPYFCKSRWA